MNRQWQPVGEENLFRSDLPAILQVRRPAPLRSTLAVMMVMILGALLGIVSAYVVIERDRPLLPVAIGPWEAYPQAGTRDSDPYSIAIYTRGALVPLASGEGLMLTAYSDSNGRRLDPTCTYTISGQTPTARFWTLTATTASGRLQETYAGRTYVTSDQLLRREDGSFEITAAVRPEPGNWLPLPRYARPRDGLVLTVRLYDAPVTTGGALDGVSMPSITRGLCQ
ncbi:DUF1214 domain-containing protein [Roseibium sediminis]|uniref:DUF1214 domain-containing protein n=1 Tax=Roseibium sediminis TaxID=1775174 RepID=UPI00123E31CC|nr:DUF1214 domain-containing protein [Roseibium sediminis]